MLVGNIYQSKGQNGNIYTASGISPSIISGVGDKGRGIGSCNSPKVLLLDDYNGAIHQDGEIGAVTTTWGHRALRNGWKIMEIYKDEEEDSEADQ